MVTLLYSESTAFSWDVDLHSNCNDDGLRKANVKSMQLVFKV